MASQATLPAADARQSTGIASAPARFRYDSTDVHEYGESLKCWSLDYDQISPGAFRGSLSGTRFSRLEVFRETTSRKTRQRGTLGTDCFTLGVPWAETGVTRCNGAAIAGPDTVLLSLDAEIELFTPDDFEVRGLSTSARMMQQLASDMDLEWPRHFQGRALGIRAAPDALVRFKGRLAFVQERMRARRDLDAPSGAERALEDGLLVEALNLVVSGEPLQLSKDASRRTVDRARDLMLSLEGKSMTLLDVCRQVGASPRKLTYCFREQLGVSPGYYWKVIRLNRARKDLQRAAPDGTDIYSVVARHGFWHLSQFSQDYKRHFVERPSDTVRNARRRMIPARGL